MFNKRGLLAIKSDSGAQWLGMARGGIATLFLMSTWISGLVNYFIRMVASYTAYGQLSRLNFGVKCVVIFFDGDNRRISNYRIFTLKGALDYDALLQ